MGGSHIQFDRHCNAQCCRGAVFAHPFDLQQSSGLQDPTGFRIRFVILLVHGRASVLSRAGSVTPSLPARPNGRSTNLDQSTRFPMMHDRRVRQQSFYRAPDQSSFMSWPRPELARTISRLDDPGGACANLYPHPILEKSFFVIRVAPVPPFSTSI